MKIKSALHILVFAVLNFIGTNAFAQQFSNDSVVNSTTLNNQEEPAISSTSNGYFIAWTDHSRIEDDPDGRAIRGQLFDASGLPSGSEFLVNSATQGAQANVQIATLENGDLIVVFEDNSQLDIDLSFGAVRARRFNSAGVPYGDDFVVNTTTNRDQFDPEVAALACGGYVVVWTDRSEEGNDTSGTSIRARHFDSDDVPLTDDFVVNQTTEGSQLRPSVAALDGCHSLVVWEDESQIQCPETNSRISGRIIAPVEFQLSNEFIVSGSLSDGNASYPTVATNTRFTAMVSWLHDSGRDIHGRIFDQHGTAQTGVISVASLDSGKYAATPIVAQGPGMGFAVAWEVFDPLNQGLASTLAVRTVSETGTPDLSFNIASSVADIMREPALARIGISGIALTWRDFGHSGPDSDGTSIRATRLLPLGANEQANIFAALLPSARSGNVQGESVTVFYSIAAGRENTAFDCQILADPNFSVPLTYRAVDATNVAIGPVEPVFDINRSSNAGFVIALNPENQPPLDGQLVVPQVECLNASIAEHREPNGLTFSIDQIEGPDIISIAATPSNDGITQIPPSGSRTGIMAVSAMNIGASDGLLNGPWSHLYVRADTGLAALPVTVTVCQMDDQANCTTPRFSEQFRTVIQENEPVFFGVFVQLIGDEEISFDPSNARVFLRLLAGNKLRSVTSVAVTSTIQ